MDGYASAHNKLKSCWPAMSQQLVELAQLLHAMQQQQMLNESVVNETLTQLALQLKQQEQAQAHQIQHSNDVQHRLDELLEAVGCIQQQQEQQQEQQQLGNDAAAEQKQLASQALAAVQEQQQSLTCQPEHMRQEQQDTVQKLKEEQQRWQHEHLEAIQKLQQEQALWRAQQQQVLAQQQQKADSMQQQQQSWCQQQEQAVQAMQQQLEELKHAAGSASHTEELQRQLDQQQQQGQESLKAIGSLQANVQQLAEQLQDMQCQQHKLCNKVNQPMTDDAAAAEAVETALEQQAAVSHGVLDQVMVELERRLLHAVRVEGEAGQQLLELRVTAMYERMKGDVMVTQQGVAAQLQQLSSEVQAALASQQQQQQHGAAPSQRAHSSATTADAFGRQQAGWQQPSDLLNAMQDQGATLPSGQSSRCSPDGQFRRNPIELSVGSPASKQLPRATASQAGTISAPGLPGQLHSQQVTAKPHSKNHAWLSADTACCDGKQQLQPAAACAAGAAANGNARRPQGATHVKAACTSDVAGRSEGVSRKVLNDQEVDVVLQLLGALHGTQ